MEVFSRLDYTRLKPKRLTSSENRPAWIHTRKPLPLKRHEARFGAVAFNHILKMQDLLASFLQFLGCNRTFRQDASRIFAGFLSRQQSFKSPIKLSMHSLFVAKDLVHILCRRERAMSQLI